MPDQEFRKKIKSEFKVEEKREEENKENLSKQKISKMQKKKIDIEEESQTIMNFLYIPIIKLDVFECEMKSIKLNKIIPIISKEERELPIPIFIKSNLKSESNLEDFNKIIPKITPQEHFLIIPEIKWQDLKKIRATFAEFYNIIPKIRPKILSAYRIPIFKVLNRPTLLSKISIFNSSIENEIIQKLLIIETQKKVDEEEVPQKEVIKLEQEVKITQEGSDSDTSFEIPLEKIFGFDSIDLSGKPVIIFINDSNNVYTPILEKFCQRLYREIKGGHADPKKIPSSEQFKHLIEGGLKAERKIFTIDYVKETNDENGELEWENIRYRFEELYNQNLGFIIFRNFEFKEEYLTRDHRDINFLVIDPNDYLKENFDIKKKLCSLLWGFVKIPEDVLESGIMPTEFNSFYDLAKKNYYFILKNIGEPYEEATEKHEDISMESDEHYWLKRFSVKFIANELGYNNLKDISSIKKVIHTEKRIINILKETDYEYSNLDSFRFPDIYVNKNSNKFSNESFEIETLFGQGQDAMNKITRTIEKYKKNSIKKLNIILENITLLRHLREIKQKIKLHEMQHQERGFSLEFWTLDVNKNKLITLNEFLERSNDVVRGDYLPIFQTQKWQ